MSNSRTGSPCPKFKPWCIWYVPLPDTLTWIRVLCHLHNLDQLLITQAKGENSDTTGLEILLSKLIYVCFIWRLCVYLPCLLMHVSHLPFIGICALYERKLKEINPAIRNISYEISDLYNFIDGLADLSALVYASLYTHVNLI